MRDLRLDSGVFVIHGVIDASQISKADAEKLLTQISAETIGSDGEARPGYLKVRADAHGNMRFTAGCWGRVESTPRLPGYAEAGSRGGRRDGETPGGLRRPVS
jgi:hypothetical protein